MRPAAMRRRRQTNPTPTASNEAGSRWHCDGCRMPGMPSKFDAFRQAPHSLCDEHGVSLTPQEGRIVLWDRSEASKPVTLLDPTESAGPRAKPLPASFETLAAGEGSP